MRAVLVSTLLVLALSTSGCTLFLVGAGATGGYMVAKDPRSAGQIFSDAGITGKVKTKFAKDRQVNALDINVDTHNARVTLNGHVQSSGTENRAIAIARGVKGVQSVKSKLVVVGR